MERSQLYCKKKTINHQEINPLSHLRNTAGRHGCLRQHVWFSRLVGIICPKKESNVLLEMELKTIILLP